MRKLFKNFGVASVLAMAAAVPAMAQEVNIYTTREPGLIQPILDSFTAETGIAVNTVFLESGLIERVQSEGESSPADLLMAVYAAKELDLDSITYEQLDDEEFRGKLCIRSGQHPYNTAMFAAYMAKYGEDATRSWLEGIKANQARAAAGGDRDGARDIAAGVCDIAVANSYYYGLMASGSSGDEQKGWSDAVKVILPTFEGGGTLVNVSGAAVAAHAPNREQAVELLEYLVSDAAQKLYAEANFEYPVTTTAEVHPIIAAFGTLEPDS